MKKLILILSIMVVGFASNSQEWKKLWEYDVLGVDMGMSPSQMRVDPTTNHLWFTCFTRMFTFGEGISEYIFYSDYGLAPVEFFALKDNVVWTISTDNIVTGQLYSYDGSVVNHEADLGVMAYTIEFDNEDTLWIGSNSWDNIGVHAFKDGNYIYYNDMNSPLLNMNVYNIFEDTYGRKWISFYNPESSSSNGILMWQINLGTSVYFSYYQGHNLPQFNDVIKAVQSPTGAIWLAASQGIFKYDEVDEDWIQYNTDNTNMPGNYVTDIQFDNSGKMWALFKDKALAYTYNMTDWVAFDSTNSPFFDGGNFGIRSFAIDTLDNIWTADKDFLYVYNINGLQGWLNNEELESNPVQVYPNPVTDYLFIDGNFQDGTEVLVYNMTGQLASKFELTDGKIDLSRLKSGQYIVKILSDDNVHTQQIVKN